MNRNGHLLPFGSHVTSQRLRPRDLIFKEFFLEYV